MMPRIPCQYCQKEYMPSVLKYHEDACDANPAKGAPPPLPPGNFIEQGHEVYTDGVSKEEMTKALSWAPLYQRNSLSEIAYDELRGILDRISPEQLRQVNMVLEEKSAVVEQPVTTSSEGGLFRPTLNPHFVVTEELGQKISRVLIASHRHPKNILFTGPQGSGKTSLAQQMAAKDNRFCYIVPCVTMQEPAQWWGRMEVSPERGTYYVASQFVRSLETPDCVIVLDDMNRVENPKVLNPLFPLLDDRRETYLDDLDRSVKVASGVIFVGTINEGFAFQGTDPIDLALRDRFDQIRIDYPPADQIVQILQNRTGIQTTTANMLGMFARRLADHPTEPIFISIRQMIAIAEDIVLGGSVRDAIDFTISAGFTEEDTEKVKQILQTILQDDYTARVPVWRTW